MTSSTAGPEHPLRFAIEPGSGGLKTYLLVRGRLEALVTRALTYDLVGPRRRRTEGRGLGLWSGGAFFPLPESSPVRPADGMPAACASRAPIFRFRTAKALCCPRSRQRSHDLPAGNAAIGAWEDCRS